MDLDINVETTANGTRILLLSGSMDLQSRGLLAPGAGLGLTQTTHICLDLSGITFIDSSGIGAIVELAGDAEDAGISFSLRRPSALVRRILEMTGLLHTWPIDEPINEDDTLEQKPETGKDTVIRTEVAVGP